MRSFLTSPYNAYHSTKHYLYEKTVNLLAKDKAERDFETTGELTPQEFIEAGDHLHSVSPLWVWQSASEAAKGPLPREKSFLMYRGAPCRSFAQEDFEFRDLNADDTHRSSTSSGAQEASSGSDSDADAELEGMIVRTNRDVISHIYDVSLTFSQAHHTPQIFFTGYTADRSRLLTDAEMETDVSEAYFGVDRTVTIERHPFLDTRSISVHPCRHAESMRRQVARARAIHDESQKEFPVEDQEPFAFPTHTSLILFLKFISAVTPTILYDTTSEFIF